MAQELSGKWYVYRYNPSDSPALKAPETTLEISRQTETGCLARLELSRWTEPVEVEMVAKAGEWRSNRDGSFGFLDIRWAHVDHGESAVLVGQVLNPDIRPNLDGSLLPHDYFVAVRSRRTRRLPLPNGEAYRFGGAYLALFEEETVEIARWRDDHQRGVQLDLNGKVLQIGDNSIYDIDFDFSLPRPYLGGFTIFAQKRRSPEIVGVDQIALWVLPVVEPGQSGRLLATGFHEYHQEVGSAGRPECNFGLHLIGE